MHEKLTMPHIADIEEWSKYAPPVRSTLPLPRLSTDDPYSTGYCYLHLVRPADRLKASGVLGRNPYMLSVFCWLQENIGLWSSERVEVSYGVPAGTGDGRAFTQVHVSPSGHGLKHQDVLRLPAFGCRLGATIVPTDAEVGGAGPARLSAGAAPATPVVRLPFVALLSKDNPTATLSPRAAPEIVQLTKFFESATIVSLEAMVSVGGGPGVMAYVGVSGGARAPGDAATFTALPVCAIFGGSSDTRSVGVFELPSDHSFGREVKAVAVGNPDPVFHFRAEFGTPGNVIVRGTLVLRLGGAGVPTPFQLPK